MSDLPRVAEIPHDDLRLKAYKKIVVPHTQAKRYSTLLGDCKEMISFAVDDAHFYRICRMAIANLLENRGNRQNKDNGPNLQSQIGTIKAPERR